MASGRPAPDAGIPAGLKSAAVRGPGMRLKLFGIVCRRSVEAWIDDHVSSMGAAIAFYTVFSIAPLLLIVIAVAGLLFSHSTAQERVIAEIGGLIGPAGAASIQDLLAHVGNPAHSRIAAATGGAALLIGATSVFAELQSALNRIWRAPADRMIGGLWRVLRTRLLSFGMILGVGFVALVSLLVSAALSALGNWWGPIFGVWQVALQTANALLSFFVITIVFAMIYKWLPRARIGWRDVWVGALVTAMLFEIGKELIGVYLGTSGITSTFGAAGSLALALLWVYYSAQVFLLGAEFTWVFAHELGTWRGPPASARSNSKSSITPRHGSPPCSTTPPRVTRTLNDWCL